MPIISSESIMVDGYHIISVVQCGFENIEAFFLSMSACVLYYEIHRKVWCDI